MLPQDAKARKDLPIGTGVLDYFPLALAEIARVSKVGNDQHNPGQPLHWDKSKSQDESDCMIRHYLQRNEKDTDGTLHAAKMAWRALAFLERFLEKRKDSDAKDTPKPNKDYLEFAPGGIIGCSRGEQPADVALTQRLKLREINVHLNDGSKLQSLDYDSGLNESVVVLSSVPGHYQYPNSHRFVVRGKVQRASDSERGALQPGSDDSGESQLTLWDAGPNYLTIDTSIGGGEDQRQRALRSGTWPRS